MSSTRNEVSPFLGEPLSSFRTHREGKQVVATQRRLATYLAVAGLAAAATWLVGRIDPLSGTLALVGSVLVALAAIALALRLRPWHLRLSVSKPERRLTLRRYALGVIPFGSSDFSLEGRRLEVGTFVARGLRQMEESGPSRGLPMPVAVALALLSLNVFRLLWLVRKAEESEVEEEPVEVDQRQVGLLLRDADGATPLLRLTSDAALTPFTAAAAEVLGERASTF